MGHVLRVCRHCGSYFKTLDPEQIYCSDICKSLEKKRKLRMKKAERESEQAAAEFFKERIRHAMNKEYRCCCLYCLRIFWSRDRDITFCSDACEKIHNMR